MSKNVNRYTRIIETIFFNHYQEGATEVAFDRSEITQAAQNLDIALPKNLGDLVYTFRYRGTLPESITDKAPVGYEWVLRPAGRARYRLDLARQISIVPSQALTETKIPDATPGIITKYALSDEQALLARLRYNRLIDVFTGLTCYSLQNHLRTTAPGVGQVETDEVYIGVDKRGAHYVMPVQAKGANEKIGIVQIEQDLAMCAAKFPHLICRPIAAQFMTDQVIGLFELEQTSEGITVSAERHYRLVQAHELSLEELRTYQQRLV
jgi:hypothetical protein